MGIYVKLFTQWLAHIEYLLYASQYAMSFTYILIYSHKTLRSVLQYPHFTNIIAGLKKLSNLSKGMKL